LTPNRPRPGGTRGEVKERASENLVLRDSTSVVIKGRQLFGFVRRRKDLLEDERAKQPDGGRVVAAFEGQLP
jgi:hypothetical protein